MDFAGDASPIALVWEAGPECDRHDAILKTVGHLVGARKVSAAKVTATAHVKRSGKAWTVLLETEQLGEKGERRFEGSTCDKVADATALILSVMLAPVETAESTIGAPAKPVSIAEPAKPPPPRDVPAVKAAPAAGVPPSGAIGARVGGDAGSLPGPTAFLGIALSASLGPTHLALLGTAWLPREATEGSHGVRVTLWTGGVRGCVELTTGAPLLLGCLAGELGRSSGSGFGIATPRSSSAWWGAVIPGLALRTGPRKVPVHIGLEAPIPVVQPVYDIEPYGELFRPSRVVVRLSLGVDWVFG